MVVPERLVWAVESLDPQPGERVLEIGCGRGVAVELLCDRRCAVTAIDRSATAIEAARKRNARHVAAGSATFVRAELGDGALPGGPYEKVFAVNVNVFWVRPDAGLQAVKRVLAPGGSLHLFYEPPGVSKREEIAVRAREALAAGGFTVTTRARGLLLGLEARVSPGP